MKTRILAFDLFSGISPQSQLLSKTLAQLDPQKFEVTYLSCGKLLTSYCNVMESRKRALSLTSKMTDCTDCSFTAGLNAWFLTKQKLSTGKAKFLSQFISDEDDLIVRDLVVQFQEEGYPLDFAYEGMPLSRLALFDTILRYKKLDLSIKEEEADYFLGNFENCARVFFAGSRFIQSNQKFDLVVCPNPQYGPNNTFAKVCLQSGVTTYALESSWNLDEMFSSVVLWRYDHLPQTSVARRTWRGANNVRPTASDINRADAHKRQLLSGKSPFVYSAPHQGNEDVTETRKVLGIPKGRKVLLMSLSSTDEVLASQVVGLGQSGNYPGTVFGNQFEWVEQTIRWAANRGDVTVVVRLHPRDLPNKRESVESEQYSRWIDLLEGYKPSVAINHPSQRLSFRRVCRAADLVATGWSSTAIEAMMLGKVVVTYDSDLPGFPSDIHVTGETKEQYFRNLDTFINARGYGDKSSALADSWLIHKVVYGSVQLTGRAFEKTRNSGPTIIRLIFSGLDRYLFFIWRPLELFATFRISRERNRIQSLLLERKPDLYC
jgi:hypothetical protein